MLFMMLFIGIRGIIGTFLLNGCFFSHADFADYADLSSSTSFNRRRDLSGRITQIFHSCNILKYIMTRNICVICEICVTKKHNQA